MKDNEEIYDQKIAPLMAQIIDIVKEAGMNMFATFQYAPRSEEEGTPLCTSLWVAEKDSPESDTELFKELGNRALHGKPSQMVAMTITSLKGN